jgi:cation diffusion facilitator CzcD-associated flavoprotein CzcO
MTATMALEFPDPGLPGPLPVAVIGAGPIGLVAAAHLVARGETPIVLEAGQAVGASIREWAHVRLFSPWKYLIDPVARQLLEPSGWQAPSPDRLPTGGELVAEFLEPLAALREIAPHLRLGHQVLGVTRRGIDKVRTAGRETTPFELIVRGPDGTTQRVLARAVIDASGTWRDPNPLGAGGVPAAGEAEFASQVRYGIPDVLGRDRARYAGRRSLVVGSGHSAFNALLDLAALAEQAPGTEIVWAIRRTEIGLLFGGGRKDALEARGALGSRLQRMVTSGRVEFLTGIRVETIRGGQAGRLTVEAADGRRIANLDEVIVTAGFRPDLTLTRELRLKLDPWLEAPEQLAPLIDPNLHSCGTVYPHGATELAHPERDFYMVGMKSYGRAPTFLLLTGYEQVRSVVSALVGDEVGARNVELVLPETGVCQTDLGGGGCCGTTEEAADAELVGLTVGASAIAAEAVAAAQASGAPERAPTAGGCGCGTAPAAAGKAATACCR